MAEKQIETKYLKGLKFRGTVGNQVEEDGRRLTKYMPFERPLRPDDVLDWKDNGPSVTLVTADGQKVTVQKKNDTEPGK